MRLGRIGLLMQCVDHRAIAHCQTMPELVDQVVTGYQGKGRPSGHILLQPSASALQVILLHILVMDVQQMLFRSYVRGYDQLEQPLC